MHRLMFCISSPASPCFLILDMVKVIMGFGMKHLPSSHEDVRLHLHFARETRKKVVMNVGKVPVTDKELVNCLTTSVTLHPSMA